MVTHDGTLIPVESSMPHAKRIENELLDEFSDMFPRDPFGHISKQEITCVAIKEFATGLEIQSFLFCDQVENEFLGIDVFVRQSLSVHQGQVVAKSACVVDKVSDGDAVCVCWHFRQVLADGIIERKESLCRQDGDDRSCELLARGAKIEDGHRRDWDAAFKVRHAVTALVNEFAIFDHPKHTTGGICFIPSGEKRVDTISKG